MIHFGGFDGQTFRIFFGQVNNIIVVNGGPLKLFFVFLAMGHQQAPLDLYPGVGYIKILVLELVQVVLECGQFILFQQTYAVIEFVFDDVH